MVRWWVGVAVCAFAPSISAEPEPTPAPEAMSWYGGAAPPPPIEHPHIHHRIARGGAFVLAGVTRVDSATYGRVDLGVPAPLRSAPRLRAIVVLESRYGTDSDMTLTRSLAVTPEAQYEGSLPFDLSGGELLVVGAAGIRRVTTWVKRPDEPFWPSTWESTAAYALRIGAGLEYRGRQGLVVSLQPLSAGVPIGRPTPPDSRFAATTPKTDYAVSVVAGYQFP